MDDGIVDVPILNIKDADPESMQLALCMYAQHVWCDGSLYCRRIKGSTIKTYVRDAALLLFKASRNFLDYRKDTPFQDAMGHHLTAIYANIDKYEKAVKRREACFHLAHA